MVVDAFFLRLPHQEVQVSGYAHEFSEKLRGTDQALSDFLARALGVRSPQ